MALSSARANRRRLSPQAPKARWVQYRPQKSHAYVIAIMNMILHGIEAPNILHVNTLAENLADVQEKDRL